MKRWPAVIVLATLVFVPAAGFAGDDGFPAPEGWKGAEEILTFNASNLWEYNNGAADAFLAFGFRDLHVREMYAGETVMLVELYDMGSPLNAYGIYRTERPADQVVVAAGAEATVVAPYQILLLKGSLYVKVELLEGEIDAGSGAALARQLAGALPGADALPAEIRALPAENRTAGSEGYARESYMGLSELKGSVHATNRTGDGKEYVVFLLVPGADETRDDVWQRLAKKWIPLERENRPPVLTRSIPYRGHAAVIRTSSGILGVAGLPDLESVLNQLEQLVPRPGP